MDYVCVVTPTYNRRKYLPNLIYQFNYQDYPRDKLFLFIYDDSPKPNDDIIENLNSELKARIKYIYDDTKKNIGYKRNRLNEEVLKYNFKYIICFDDDDYHPKNRISYSVNMLKNSNKNIGGTSSIKLFYKSDQTIYQSLDFNKKFKVNHALNGTFIYSIEYLKENRYNDSKQMAEESEFLGYFKNEICHFEEDVILAFSHDCNTFDKEILKKNIDNIKLDIKIDDIIADKYLLLFFKNK